MDLTPEEFIDAYCRHKGIRKDILMSRKRTARVIRLRHELWYELWKEFHFSSAEIGELFDRDHSTVVVGIHKIQRERQEPVGLGIDFLES